MQCLRTVDYYGELCADVRCQCHSEKRCELCGMIDVNNQYPYLLCVNLRCPNNKLRSEKPIQEKRVTYCPCNGPYTCEVHGGDYVFCSNEKCECHHRVVSAPPVQEEEKGYCATCGKETQPEMRCACPERQPNGDWKTAPPLGEGWEKEFDEQFLSKITGYVDVQPEHIKSFITNLLVSERKNGTPIEEWVRVGAKAERARIAAGVGRLRDKFHPATENGLFLNAILKIIHSEG